MPATQYSDLYRHWLAAVKRGDIAEAKRLWLETVADYSRKIQS